MYTKFKYQGKSFNGKGGDVVLLVYLSPYRSLPIARLTNVVFFYLECLHFSNYVHITSDGVLKSLFTPPFYM